MPTEIERIKNIAIKTKGKIKLMIDHVTTKNAPTLNKTIGANITNSPKVIKNFKIPIGLIYSR